MKIERWWQKLQNVPPQDDEEEQEYHPEYEKKPMTEATTLTSEEVHGGEEQSDSGEGIKPSQSMQGSESGSEKSTGEDSQNGQSRSDSNSDKLEADENSQNGQGSSDSKMQSEDGKGSEQVEQGTSDSGSDKDKNGGNSRTQSESDKTGQSGGQNSNGVSDDSESEGCGDDTKVSGQKNYRKVVELIEMRNRRLRTAFQRWLEKIAELETKIEVPGNPERLSMRQMMKRVLDHRPLSSCYVQRLKDTVILLVDTSGSMDWWTEILRVMTAIALKLKDIEIYECPNGMVTRKIENFDTQYYNWDSYKEFHEEFMRKTRSRTIIYIGDFDGGDTPYWLAKHNKVFWLCNERRYEDTKYHDWCSHSLSEYPKNCKLYRVLDEEDLVKVFRNG